jgi:hypothetical protein
MTVTLSTFLEVDHDPLRLGEHRLGFRTSGSPTELAK